MINHKIEAAAIYSALEQGNRVLIVAHKKPDADTLGSACAWINLLKPKGKHIETFCVDEVPANLKHLPGNEYVTHDPTVFQKPFDIIITNDCADLEYAGIETLLPARDNSQTTIINIDHHGTNPRYGSVNLIIPNASATTEVLARLFFHWGEEISKPIAENLLNGIIADTDSLTNPGTSYQSMVIASELVRRGANLYSAVQRTLFTRSIADLRLWGLVLSRLTKNTKYNVVSTYLTAEDLTRLNVDRQSTEGIVNYLTLIPNVNFVLLLQAVEKGLVKGSLRTVKDTIDVARLAQRFGGGGHKKASGFKTPGTLRATDNIWTIV